VRVLVFVFVFVNTCSQLAGELHLKPSRVLFCSSAAVAACRYGTALLHHSMNSHLGLQSANTGDCICVLQACMRMHAVVSDGLLKECRLVIFSFPKRDLFYPLLARKANLGPAHWCLMAPGAASSVCTESGEHRQCTHRSKHACTTTTVHEICTKRRYQRQ